MQENSSRLDEALKKFSGDFGGSADAMTVAKFDRLITDSYETDSWSNQGSGN